MDIQFKLNGIDHKVDADPEMPLLWVLRDVLNLKGTKFGCGRAACGACTVQLDGAALRSCSLPVRYAAGKNIRTIEGLNGKGDSLHPVQKAWIEEQVPQCGYCQSGFMMATAALLDSNPNPSDEDIDNALTNICRCGTYHRIRKAIHKAASLAR